MPSSDWEHLAYGQYPDKMTELSFAKQFLTTLDQRALKFQSDYAIDLRELEPSGPYTLPRMTKAMEKPEKDAAAAAAPGSAPTVKVTLKSIKNPPLDISLSTAAATTSVLDLKQKVAQETGLNSTEKIRLLYKKKPCSDSKTIRDLAGEDNVKEFEFSVMIMGGLPAKQEAAADSAMEDAPVAQGESGVDVMNNAEFWKDLEGFLLQRVRDESVAKEAAGLFQVAWKQASHS